jgi:hypothetical protein
MAENTGPKQAGRGAGRRFRPGQSGNPAGKPVGARHRITMLAEKLMEDEVDDIVRTVVTAAKSGDLAAARLVLDRIAPPRKGRPIHLSLPKMTSAGDVAAAVSAVANAMGQGELTPEEAASVAAVLEMRRKALETIEIERRVAALEQR